MARFKDDTLLATAKSKLKPPPMFKVMLLNDDYTPMEFVVIVLQKFFAMTRERATQVMLMVHQQGIGVCGVCTVLVYRLDVEEVHREWPEAHVRRRKWLAPAAAAARIGDPVLAQLILAAFPKRRRA